MATVEQSETTVVTLTEGAATKVSRLMAEEPAGEAEVLRIAIQGGGCSGFEYALYGLFALAIPATMMAGSFVFATRPHRRVRERTIPFESGVSQGAPRRQRFTVR